MEYGKRQGLSPWGKVAAFVLGLFLAGCIQSVAGAKVFHLKPNVTLRTTTIQGSRVRVATAPLRMLEAQRGCAKLPCGRQTAMLPSASGARHGAVVAIGGDFVRNGRTVHAHVHNGRTVFRGIRNGDVFDLKQTGTAFIGRGHRHQLRGAEELFGGYPQVLAHGRVNQDRGDCKNVDGPDGGFCLRQPRQGIGLSRDGERIVIIEVDGRQRGSRGVLLPEFGRLFRRFGAYNALNLDGGGSAVMWVQPKGRYCMGRGATPKGCLVSRPVYGERRVTQSIQIVP